MLRLNMAVPPTPRDSKDFSSLGLIQAAVTGLLDPAFANTNIQNIPNMDGFPNGRRLEDDVTRIELQAVGGIVLAAIGLWYDDYIVGGSPVTPKLLNVLQYSTGVEKNDAPFKKSFPVVAEPWAGTHVCDCSEAEKNAAIDISSNRKVYSGSPLTLSTPQVMATASPNPFTSNSSIRYHLDGESRINISVFDVNGKLIEVLVDKTLKTGTYTENWNGANLNKGIYYIKILKNGKSMQTLKVVKG